MLKILWRTKNSVSQFDECEDGAVTVDWVVLSAGMILFGAIMVGIYKQGVFNLSSAISDRVVSEAPDTSFTPGQ